MSYLKKVNKDLIFIVRFVVGVIMLFVGEWVVFVVFEMSWKFERGMGSWIKFFKIY